MFDSLSLRDRQPELMDQPGLLAQEHVEALAGLARLNGISRSAEILWPPLKAISLGQPGRVLRVLDVACGGGDVTIALAKLAHRLRCEVRFVGCDVSERAVIVARTRADWSKQHVDFFQADVLNTELPAGFDVIICSLFLHHLTNADAERLLRRMGEAARSLVLVNDLVRCRRGYLLAWLACRLLTRSPIVRVDGPLSVKGAFTPDEAMALASRAGLTGATISRHWPLRFLLQWRKQEDGARCDNDST